MTNHKLAVLAAILLFISISTMAICAVDAASTASTASTAFPDQSHCDKDACYIPWPIDFYGFTPPIFSYEIRYDLHPHGTREEKLKAKNDWENEYKLYKSSLRDLNKFWGGSTEPAPAAKKPAPAAKKPAPAAKKPTPAAKKPTPAAKKPTPDSGNSYFYDNYIKDTVLQELYDFVCEHPYLAAYTAAELALMVSGWWHPGVSPEQEYEAWMESEFYTKFDHKVALGGGEIVVPPLAGAGAA